MDVVGLAFTLFGHLLASVLYVWRRIPLSSTRDAVDSSSVLENKDQLRQIWERRIMADEQSQAVSESVAPNSEADAVKAKPEEKIPTVVQHGTPTVVQNGTPTVCMDSEVLEKGVPKTHNGDASDCASPETDHQNSASVSEVKEPLTNGNNSSAEADPSDHVDLPKHESDSQEKHEEHTDVPKDEKVVEQGAQSASSDTLNSESVNTNCLSDDQKAGTTDDKDKSELDHSTKGEGILTDEEKGVHSIEKEAHSIEKEAHSIEKESHSIEEETHSIEKEARMEEKLNCCAGALQVEDDTQEHPYEPDTETYYTSNFTFVCQKSQKVDADDEERKTEAKDAVCEKEVSQEFLESDVVVENTEISEAEDTPPPLEKTSAYNDNNNEGLYSESFSEEVVELDFSDSPCPECSENPENETERDIAVDGIMQSEEHPMTSDFQENHDEEEDVFHKELTHEEEKRDEIESDIDAVVCSELSNKVADDAERHLREANQNETENNHEEMREEKIERPSHFVRLKRTGVQKTERPYDSGTTESKIAMEIREMREREEELRLMRERMQSPEGCTRSASSSPLLSPTSPSKPTQANISPDLGPGYRVSTVFGHKASPVQSPSPMDEDKKAYRSFNKESAVEKEIRIARSREEELRKQKGLPPRDDDSYIKPSQVKSSQVRVFGRMNSSNTSKELATTKIQQEIEEQTLREMALREKGHIQTISQERTDSKVAKLKDLDVSVPECTSPLSPNGHGTPFSDRSSKRSTPSPTGSSHGSISPVSPRPVTQGKGISMQKFIASKGKETTFIASRNGPSHPEPSADASRSNPVMRKAKRTVSVESKIQQEILEMKLREEELRRMHTSSSIEQQPFLTSGENGTDLGSTVNEESDYINGQEINGNGNEDFGPSSNNLIAQWEQRIQKAEGRA